MSGTELYVCIIASAVTVLLRTLPFIINGLLHRKTESRFLASLNRYLTPALIGMLVIFCLKDVRFTDPTALAAGISVAVCVASYVWKRNTLLSIVFPTVLYMILIRLPYLCS